MSKSEWLPLVNNGEEKPMTDSKKQSLAILEKVYQHLSSLSDDELFDMMYKYSPNFKKQVNRIEENCSACRLQGEMMTVKDIIKKYLEDNGYDGLCNEICGCGLDDFMPCGLFACDSSVIGCKPAYKHKCPGHEKCERSGFCESNGTAGQSCYSKSKED